MVQFLYLVSALTIFSLISVSVHGKALPSSTESSSSESSPEALSGDGNTTTGPPWLRFLKNKKSTTSATTLDQQSPTPVPPTNKRPGSSSIRALPPAISQLPSAASSSPSVNEVWQWLANYLPPVPIAQQTPSMAQDRTQNPDSLYDEVYLDWMKREVDPINYPPQEDPSLFNPELTPSVMPQQPLPLPSYTYPALPYAYGYSPFFPSLTGFKMQKVMAQAQVDAAMAALNITTTPKPIKLKLKIQVPGNIDLVSLGQITSGLSNSLPVGSTYELA